MKISELNRLNKAMAILEPEFESKIISEAVKQAYDLLQRAYYEQLAKNINELGGL